MRVYFKDVTFELNWLDEGEMPFEATEAGAAAALATNERFGDDAAHKTGAVEHTAIMRQTKAQFFSVVVSNGSGIHTVNMSQSKAVMEAAMNTEMQKYA